VRSGIRLQNIRNVIKEARCSRIAESGDGLGEFKVVTRRPLTGLRRLMSQNRGKRLEVASDGSENVSEEKAQRSSASVANMNRTAASANPATRLLR